MSTATPNPPVTPAKPTAMATQNGATDIHRKLKESSSQVDLNESRKLKESLSQLDLNESRKLSEALAMREAPDKIEVPSTQPPPVIKDPPATQSQVLDQAQQDADAEPVTIRNERAASPHTLDPFDWDQFQYRYDQAMAEAKTTEEALLTEFHELANASTPSIS
jgi:hypothetical protein